MLQRSSELALCGYWGRPARPDMVVTSKSFRDPFVDHPRLNPTFLLD